MDKTVSPRDRYVARVQNMTQEERIAAHSKAMLMAEAVWQVTCDEAMSRGLEGENGERVSLARMMLKQLEAFHAEADYLACRYAGVAAAGPGSR